VREFASVPFEPPLGYEYEKVTLTRKLRSQDGGANEIEMGVGVAIVVERSTPGDFEVEAGQSALIRIDDVDIHFVPRPRNDDVQV
jgi:hypothetical protein